MVPTDPHSLAEKYTCDYFAGVTMEKFPDDCDDVEYYE